MDAESRGPCPTCGRIMGEVEAERAHQMRDHWGYVAELRNKNHALHERAQRAEVERDLLRKVADAAPKVRLGYEDDLPVIRGLAELMGALGAYESYRDSNADDSNDSDARERE